MGVAFVLKRLGSAASHPLLDAVLKKKKEIRKFLLKNSVNQVTTVFSQVSLRSLTKTYIYLALFIIFSPWTAITILSCSPSCRVLILLEPQDPAEWRESIIAVKCAEILPSISTSLDVGGHIRTFVRTHSYREDEEHTHFTTWSISKTLLIIAKTKVVIPVWWLGEGQDSLPVCSPQIMVVLFFTSISLVRLPGELY